MKPRIFIVDDEEDHLIRITNINWLIQKTEKKVLIVDDNEDNLAKMVDKLKPSGHKIMIARTKDDAMDLVRNNDFDRIICDLDLKGSSGPFARLDGYFFLKWYNKNNYNHADIVLCSTAFEKEKLNMLQNYIKQDILKLGYDVKPKKEFLQ